MNRTLMILGGSEEFIHLIELASSRGIRTVVVDGRKDSPAKQVSLEYGGTFYDEDVRNTQALAEIYKKENADAVTAAFSDVLMENMVRLSDALGGKSWSYLGPGMLPYYRDKALMNGTFEELGIPTAKSAVIIRKGSNSFDPAVSGLEFPLIIKPLDLYGSRGIIIVNNEEEFRNKAEELCETYDLDKFLAEEYITDPEYNAQAWVREGKVHILGIADRETTFTGIPGEIPISTRNVYPALHTEELLPKVREIFKKYIRKTGQKDGQLAMQFFYGAERGISVGEITARFLGYEHELMEFANGFSVEELMLSFAFGDDTAAILEKGNAQGDRSAAVLYFQGREGKVLDISAVQDAFDRPEVVYAKIFYSEGERIEKYVRPYAARCDIVTESREMTDKVSREIFERAGMKGENGEELLFRNKIQSR